MFAGKAVQLSPGIVVASKTMGIYQILENKSAVIRINPRSINDTVAGLLQAISEVSPGIEIKSYPEQRISPHYTMTREERAALLAKEINKNTIADWMSRLILHLSWVNRSVINSINKKGRKILKVLRYREAFGTEYIEPLTKENVSQRIIIRLLDRNNQEQELEALRIIFKEVNLSYEIVDADETYLRFTYLAEDILTKQIVGGFQGRPSESYDGKWRGMAVSRNFQDLGIGRMLFNKGIELAMDLGLTQVWIDSTEPAWKFYERMGAKITSGGPVPSGRVYMAYRIKQTLGLARSTSSDKQLILYSGPSAVGKGPLWEQIKRLYPDYFERIVLYTSRTMRPGEEEGVDYYFRTAEQIMQLEKDNPDFFITLKVHSDIQGIDIRDVEEAIKSGKIAIAEVSVDWAARLREKYSNKVYSIFISPLSDEEIKAHARTQHQSQATIIYREMIKRQNERNKEKPTKQEKRLERAKNAIAEMARRDEFDAVIVNSNLRDISAHQSRWESEEGKVLVEHFMLLVRQGVSESDSANPKSDEPKNYPARLVGEPIIPTDRQISNRNLYFGDNLQDIVFVDKTQTGNIADLETIPGKIAILDGFTIRAPPFDLDNPQSQVFQTLVNDILRHEFEELETSSHELACQASYEYFQDNPAELTQLFTAIKEFGIELDEDYRTGLDGAQAGSDLDRDMFRDYDYRTRGQEITPLMSRYIALTWAKMGLDRKQKLKIDSNTVVVAKDCRDIDPEITSSLIEGLRYVGLDVIDAQANNPNCVSSYAWAVMKYNPLMSIFITASHVSDEGVSGFKVMIQNQEGELQSLTTQEIKEESLKIVEELIVNPDRVLAMQAANPGTYTTADIDQECVRQVALVARVAEQGLGVYKLADEFEQERHDVTGVLTRWEERVSTTQPLSGLKVVIEGANTPSGQIAYQIFKELGAEAVLLHGEVLALKGKHKADPSKDENLADLKAAIDKEGADFGLAFDLDGDRVAVVFNKKDGSKESLPPDTLIAILLPFLVESCGYSLNELKAQGKTGIAVVRDVLGTEAVDKLAAVFGVETYQTDAGYVFLKAMVRVLKAKGFVVPIYGESSGHGWLHVSGPVENPMAIAALLAVALKQYKQEHAQVKYLIDEFINEITKDMLAQHNTVVSYKRSGRFDPKFHPALLDALFNEYVSQMSQQERDRRGIGSWNPVEGGKLPQIVIAFGKDYVIRRMLEDFPQGKTFATSQGELKVQDIDAYEEEGIYRYADVRFSLNNEYIGRFIFRASANDPNFVCSFECPYQIDTTTSQDSNPEKTSLKYDLVGGIIMDWLDTNKLSPIGDDSVEFKNKANVIPSLMNFRKMQGGTLLVDLLQAAGKQTKEEIHESNLFREIGFEGKNSRLGWIIPPDWQDIQDNLEAFLEIAKDKEYFIFIGMGGSINTVKALIEILGRNSKYKVFAYDQLDPAALDEISSQIDDWQKVLVVSISKSATTKETHVLSSNLREIFENKALDYQSHYLWLIDEGGYPKLAERGWEGVSNLPIQPDKHTDIGGRFTAPHTLIFFLPLLILLGKDIEQVKALYEQYLTLVDSLRKAADQKARQFYQDKSQYFGVKAAGALRQAMLTWIAQLIQESMGSKTDGFNPKTLVVSSQEELPKFFSLIETPAPENSVLAMMQTAYYLQVFVALLSYYYGINFVTQDQVEIYKKKMRELEEAEIPPAEEISLPELVQQIQNSLTKEHRFVEAVFYAHQSQEYIDYLQEYLQRHLSQRVLVFIGSDWNHHSYQAASRNEDTLFVILTKKEFLNQVEGVKQETLGQNIKDLRVITYATYETIKDKAEYFALGAISPEKALQVVKQEIKEEEELINIPSPYIRGVDELNWEASEEKIGNVRRRSELKEKAKALVDVIGKKHPEVWHINSAGVGGGVADILKSLIPISNCLGVHMTWIVIGGTLRFFNITKRFHNAIQGDNYVQRTEEDFDYYLKILVKNAKDLIKLKKDIKLPDPDIIVVHDPQPAALIKDLKPLFPNAKFIWRIHIQPDISDDSAYPSRQVWDFLKQYVELYDAGVNHQERPIFQETNLIFRQILPSINPLEFINIELPVELVAATCEKYGILQDRPIVIQNARHDPWKDPEGVMESWVVAIESLVAQGKNLFHLPRLVLSGPMAGDDPQAIDVLKRLKERKQEISSRLSRLSSKYPGKEELFHALSDKNNIIILPLLTSYPTEQDIEKLKVMDIPANTASLSNKQRQILRTMGYDPDSFRVDNVNDLDTNALQTAAFIGMLKSTKEGFGLAVSGIGYHGKYVIVSGVGGILPQVIDIGKDPVNGTACVVGIDPNTGEFNRELSIEQAADYVVKIINNEIDKDMPKRARQYVIDNFLPDRHLLDWYNLFLDVIQNKKYSDVIELFPPKPSEDTIIYLSGPKEEHTDEAHNITARELAQAPDKYPFARPFRQEFINLAEDIKSICQQLKEMNKIRGPPEGFDAETFALAYHQAGQMVWAEDLTEGDVEWAIRILTYEKRLHFSQGVIIGHIKIHESQSTEEEAIRAQVKEFKRVREFGDTIIKNLDDSSNLLWALIRDNPEAKQEFKERCNLLAEGNIAALVKDQLKQLVNEEKIIAQPEDIEGIDIILFGDWFWRPKNDRSNDLDIIVLFKGEGNYREVIQTNFNNIPPLAAVIFNVEDFKKRTEDVKKVALALLGSGVVVHSGNLISEIEFGAVLARDILNWAEGLFDAAGREEGLGELGDLRKQWKRNWDALLYIQYLLSTEANNKVREFIKEYIIDEQPNAFKKQTLKDSLGENFSFKAFFIQYYLGKIETFPWLMRESIDLIQQFARLLDSLREDIAAHLITLEIDRKFPAEMITDQFPDKEWNLRILNPDIVRNAEVTLDCNIENPDDLVKAVLSMGILRLRRLYGTKNIRLVLNKRYDVSNGLDEVLRYCCDSMAYREGGKIIELDTAAIRHRKRIKAPVWIDSVLYQHARLQSDAEDVASSINAKRQRIIIDKAADNPFLWKVALPEGLKNKNVVLIHSTENSVDFAELWIMLMALRRAGVGYICLHNTYEGYSREDKVFKHGKGVSAATMLRITNSLVDFHTALNVHFGGKSGRVKLRYYELYNLNAFVQVAEGLFDKVGEFIGRDKLARELQKHPILLLGPDDGAFGYILEASEILKRTVKEEYGINIDIHCAYLDKTRISGTQVRIPGYILGANNEKIYTVAVKGRSGFIQDIDINQCWTFVIDDETSQGSTLLAATYALVEKMGFSWMRVLTGVVHGKLARGLDPFKTGVDEEKINEDTKPGPQYIDHNKEHMPPRLFICTKSVALPEGFPEKQSVSIGPLISYEVKDIIGYRGLARELVSVIVDSIRSMVDTRNGGRIVSDGLESRFVDIIGTR
ncbi:GNAT family N-acetyltransferase [Candidatus Omnitrophota bacterium]